MVRPRSPRTSGFPAGYRSSRVPIQRHRSVPPHLQPWAADTSSVDHQMRWLRRTIVRTIYQRTIRWFAAVFAALCLLALIRGGLRVETGGSATGGVFDLSATGRLGSEPLRPSDVVAALFVAQVVTGLRLALAIEFNPLNRRYLNHYTERLLRFRAVRPEGEPHAVAEPIASYGLHHTVTVGAVPDKGQAPDPAMIFDIYQSANRVVTVAVGRASGSVTVLTELDDHRIVITSDAVVLPHDSLLANAVPGANLVTLLASHRSLLESLIGRAPRGGRMVRPAATSPDVFVRSMQLEQASFQCLGSVVGSFCDLLERRLSWRLMYRLDAEAIRSLSFDNDMMNDGTTRSRPPLRRSSAEATVDEPIESSPVAV